MRKRALLFLISLLTVLAVIPAADAFFTRSHEYWTIDGLNNVQSAVTQQCGIYKAQVVDGNTAADVPVLHYFDNQFMTYISTHTRGSGYWACLEAAGTDLEQRCLCVGVGLHIVQDSFSHLKGGIVPKYIKKFASSNLFGHMVIERDFELKHMKYLEDKQDPVLTSGELDYYDEHVLCTFMEPIPNEDGIITCPDAPGDPKYHKLLERMSGISMINDLNIFQGGYLGTGFYNTVYNEKVKLPFWFWGVSIGLIIMGVGIALFAGITGKNKWKWVVVFEFIILLAAPGAIVLTSFLTHSTWQVTQFVIEVPGKLGMMEISDQDIEDYDRAVKQATAHFLTNGGQLLFDDASGLSYIDRDGNAVKGELAASEKMFKFGIFPVIVLVFILMNVFFFVKAYELKFGFRRKQ